MTRDEIIKLARAAGFAIDSLWMTYPSLALPDLLEHFAALVAAKEREACAQIGDGYDYGDRNCGDEIRARGMNDGLHK